MSSRLEMIQTLIDKGSSDPFVWYGRAMELRSLGKLQEAMLAFEDVRARFAAYVPVYLMAAQTAQMLGDIKAVRLWLTEGIAAAKEAQNSHALAELEAMLANFAPP